MAEDTAGGNPLSSRPDGVNADSSLRLPGIVQAKKDIKELREEFTGLRKELSKLDMDKTGSRFLSNIAASLAAIAKSLKGVGGNSSGFAGGSVHPPTVFRRLDDSSTADYVKAGAEKHNPTGNVPLTIAPGAQAYSTAHGGAPALGVPGAPTPVPIPWTGGGGGRGGGGGGTGVSGAAKPGDSGLSGVLDGLNLATAGGGGLGAIGGAISSLVLAPLRLAYNRVEENRQASMMMAQHLGPSANRMGIGGEQRIGDLIGMLSESIPIRGGLNEILGAIDTGTRMGYGLSGSRSGGMWGAARQFQMMNPSIGASSIVDQVGSFAGSAQQNKLSMKLTGGAFGMAGRGGTTKTLQEWAEGILRFFENQRPGSKRGKAFTKEEIDTQRFPGSNMFAWFEANAVPEYMVDAFWQYAAQKASMTGSTQGDVAFDSLFNQGGDQFFERIKGLTSNARRDLVLASSSGPVGNTMYSNYVDREKTDSGFQNAMSMTLDKLLGSLMAPMGGIMSNMPTPIADLLASGLFNQVPNLVTGVLGAVPMVGDPGYASTGSHLGSGLGGLSQSMQGKVGAMMRDNPRLQVVSGHRDSWTQGVLGGKSGLGANMAPPGHSSHSSGNAADLGPASEYDWIAQNAHRYGLDSGARHGEKWHVNLPGVSPIFAGQSNRPQTGIGDFYTGIPGIDIITSVGGGILDRGAEAVGGVVGGIKEAAEWALPVKDALGGNFGPLGDKVKSAASSIGNTIMTQLFKLLGLDSFNPTTGDWSEYGGGKGSGTSSPFGGSSSGGSDSGGRPMGLHSGSVGNFTSGSMIGADKNQLKLMVQQMANERNWGQYWPDIDWLVNKESSWNPNAQNPTSTAYGLFQFLNSTWKGTGIAKTNDPRLQTEAGFKYIASRYGDPSRAVAHHRAKNWYGDGGLLTTPQVIGASENGPEVVLPLTRPERARELINNYVTPAIGNNTAAGGLTIIAPITVSVRGGSSGADLHRVGRQIQTHIEDIASTKSKVNA